MSDKMLKPKSEYVKNLILKTKPYDGIKWETEEIREVRSDLERVLDIESHLVKHGIDPDYAHGLLPGVKGATFAFNHHYWAIAKELYPKEFAEHERKERDRQEKEEQDRKDAPRQRREEARKYAEWLKKMKESIIQAREAKTR